MSVNIDWEALTTGPDGLALAESIRDFIHEKFQQVQLPKFIRTVKVHSFEFGKESPTVVLKDVCDPLDEFYGDEDESDDEGNQGDSNTGYAPAGASTMTSGELKGHGHVEDLQSSIETLKPSSKQGTNISLQERRGLGVSPPQQLNSTALSNHNQLAALQIPGIRTSANGAPYQQHVRNAPSFVDQLASPLLQERARSPGIPGGTANLSYFHHTPFSHHSHPFPAPWSDYGFSRPGLGQPPSQPYQAQYINHQQYSTGHQPSPLRETAELPEFAARSAGDPSTRPSTATTQTPLSRVTTGSHEEHTPSRPENRRSRDSKKKASRGKRHQTSSLPLPPSPGFSERLSDRPEPNPMDLQLILHVKYSGGIRLALSAEILLDYPMSSFVSIPLQLTVTGISFDGVAIVAHVRPPLEHSSDGLDSMADSSAVKYDDEEQEQQQEEDKNRGRAHICFLSPDDAKALLGAESGSFASQDDDDDDDDDYVDDGTRHSNGMHYSRNEASPSASRVPRSNAEQSSAGGSWMAGTQEQNTMSTGSTSKPDSARRVSTQDHNSHNGSTSITDEDLGGLLKEIRVESEIGQRRDGQQSLRNVGKVEKFLLEQVRRIFEDEFVWPSFWTFLL